MSKQRIPLRCASCGNARLMAREIHEDPEQAVELRAENCPLCTQRTKPQFFEAEFISAGGEVLEWDVPELAEEFGGGRMVSTLLERNHWQGTRWQEGEA